MALAIATNNLLYKSVIVNEGDLRAEVEGICPGFNCLLKSGHHVGEAFTTRCRRCEHGVLPAPNGRNRVRLMRVEIINPMLGERLSNWRLERELARFAPSTGDGSMELNLIVVVRRV